LQQVAQLPFRFIALSHCWLLRADDRPTNYSIAIIVPHRGLQKLQQLCNSGKKIKFQLQLPCNKCLTGGYPSCIFSCVIDGQI